ncbi:MAG: glycosyltransferase family 2 protein [Bacteroidetes bacterium]|nr:glycosyltransferase family 2 protein [Bacteroidota bacterium]MDA0944000.1 glycosyltransferase family 2 protein [Bacteroidota bacterium]MDA1112207.1 glycosyltransferase family 2 protein [Bacteroidota bacterium]
MVLNQKVVVVLPAYNAQSTLAQTLAEIDRSWVDDIVLVDDASQDATAELAKELGIQHVLVHEQNRGYGGNQKSCYRKALDLGADIVVMVHPDYQYTPKLLNALISMVASGVYDAVFASRILGKGALQGGMPRYKYWSNRFLTAIQNMLMGQHLSEYHTGYRAYHKRVLNAVNFDLNSDDFVFDNQIVAQTFKSGFSIGELSCPTRYFPEASSINFRRSVTYGLGVLGVSLQYRLHKWGLYTPNYLR